MTHLLDTAPWLNAALMPQVLPARIRRVLQDGEDKALCRVSLLEAAILHRLCRLEFTGELNNLFSVALAQDVRLVEVTPEIAACTNRLPERFPGDPFDRTIVATAAVLDLTLITADAVMRDAKFCRVEYCPFRRRG